VYIRSPTWRLVSTMKQKVLPSFSVFIYFFNL
jgi:hypothetical protein